MKLSHSLPPHQAPSHLGTYLKFPWRRPTRIKMRYFICMTMLLTAPLYAADHVPRVLVIGTGGTIAGTAESSTDLHYDPGKLSVDAILRTVPDIKQQVDAHHLELEGQ